MKEIEEKTIDHSDFPGQKPYDIQSLKKLPLDIRINKVIDIIDYIQNVAFRRSHPLYFRDVQKIIKGETE